MEKIEIENAILKYFYNCWELGSHCTIHSIFKKLNQVNEKVIERIGDELENLGLIEGLKRTPFGKLTAKGIIETENRGIIPIEKVKRNGDIRYSILEFAFNVYETNNYDELVTDHDVISNYEISSSEFYCNLDFLEELGMIYSDSINLFHINIIGIEQFKEWQKQKSFVDTFDKISQVSPQQRGREFQKLLSYILEYNGWQQEESVKTSYEEIDVIVHKNREFHLIECKWEKVPIEAKEINNLFGKLSKRANTNGIIVSMSGFTSGAVQAVQDSANQKLIILFGQEDFKEILYNRKSFEELLDKKYKELVMRRKAVWN